jgi:hypothetical protein
MTLDMVARMTQAEFGAIRKEMGEQFGTIREVMGTRADLKDFNDGIVHAVQQENLKVLASNDKLMSKFDVLLKENAAHTGSHTRVEDTLHEHDKRLKNLEGAPK